ncbi:MAG: cupin domain-containing protein [Ignavibacteriales bacterium]|nr:cupin domain-containing protein [Ignavibacteriales bacterium]
MAEDTNESMNDLSPKELINEVQYQSNSIVSKQILKKTNGNITLFAFDKDEALTEHTSPYEAVVYIIDGKMEIRIAGNPYDVRAGEIIVMPPNIPHGLKAIQKSKMILIMIK